MPSSWETRSASSVESADDLEEKLAQFPPGTTFVLSITSYEGTTDAAGMGPRIGRFLRAHGMRVAPPATP